MQKGKIGVTTENIFPIIKKFLYSDHEIFLRELMANAVDATQKLKALVSVGELKSEIGDITISVEIDNDAKTLKIIDRGIGMTKEEVDKYINQIAFSSAGEFLEKYKDQLSGIIGNFGLGFYSSFMVSKKVEINTLSWREGAEAVKWECDGDPEYSITESSKTDRGTEITLYLDDESVEFAENARINQLLTKYCKFMPIPISFGKEQEWKDGKYEDTDKVKIINNPNPIWTRKPSELNEEDYSAFYKDLYPMQEDALFHIHLNVDYPFNLTGVLYFPKIKEQMELSRNKIQLFSKQVFVTDSVENIVPDFLTLLHGVIDSPDIPLNVSRSYLQADSNVKKISTYIAKKVSDRLEELYKKDREMFQDKWDNLKLFIEYGMLSDEKFFERAEKFALLKNTDGKFFSYDEYKLAVEPNQTDKNKKLIYLYTTDPVSQHTYIEAAKNKGYDVLIFDCHLDAHFINLLESKFTDISFARVDADYIDKLIQKVDVDKPNISAVEILDISTIFQAVLPKDAQYNVVVENLGEEISPIIITQSEFMRRYKEMSAIGGGGMNFYGQMPDSFTITVNYQNPLVSRIMENKVSTTSDKVINIESDLITPTSELEAIKKNIEGKKDDEIDQSIRDSRDELELKISNLEQGRRTIMIDFANGNKLLSQIIDLALLSNNMLKGESLSRFVKRSLEILS